MYEGPQDERLENPGKTDRKKNWTPVDTRCIEPNMQAGRTRSAQHTSRVGLPSWVPRAMESRTEDTSGEEDDGRLKASKSSFEWGAVCIMTKTLTTPKNCARRVVVARA